MAEKQIKELRDIAQVFRQTAEKVNESSQNRKEFADQIDMILLTATQLGVLLVEKLRNVTLEDRVLHNQNYLIFNTCERIFINIKKQNQLILRMTNIPEPISPTLAAILRKNETFQAQLDSSIQAILRIIPTYNEIILFDNLLIERKGNQREIFVQLQNASYRMYEDIKRAIEGSQSNLQRGKQFLESLSQIEVLYQSKDTASIQNLINLAREGEVKAQEVHIHSQSQLLFTETVKEYAQNLYRETVQINNIVTEKREFVIEELKNSTDLMTNIIQYMNEYISIKEESEILKSLSTQLEDTTINDIQLLLSYLGLAIRDIEEISHLEHDTSRTLSQIEEISHTIESFAGKEIAIFEQIKGLVESMTEETRYPIQGSSENQANATKIVQILTEIQNSI